ncbi:hypothetical protein RCL1_000919 [Eukaryota sp. TZLM3-RCL]
MLAFVLLSFFLLLCHAKIDFLVRITNLYQTSNLDLHSHRIGYSCTIDNEVSPRILPLASIYFRLSCLDYRESAFLRLEFSTNKGMVLFDINDVDVFGVTIPPGDYARATINKHRSSLHISVSNVFIDLDPGKVSAVLPQIQNVVFANSGYHYLSLKNRQEKNIQVNPGAEKLSPKATTTWAFTPTAVPALLQLGYEYGMYGGVGMVLHTSTDFILYCTAARGSSMSMQRFETSTIVFTVN